MIGTMTASLLSLMPAHAAEQPAAQPSEALSITFSRLLVRDPDSFDIGVSTELLKLAVLEKLRAEGANAVGMESLLFGIDQSSEAELVLGGTINQLSCVDSLNSINCSVSVHWEIYDRRLEQVVLSRTTEASHVRSNQLSSRVFRDALMESLEELLSSWHYQELMRRLVPVALTERSWEETITMRRCSAEPAPLPGGVSSALASAVRIETLSGTGSGVLVSPDGFVLTAAHVVADSNAVTVVRADGLQLPAETIRVDRDHDVALLQIPGQGHPCAPVGDSPPALAESIYSIGSPGGEELALSISRGVVSGYREWDSHRFLQTDASINPGNSGGPLLNDAGQVVAITSGKISGPGFEGLGFGVPISVFSERLQLAWGERSSGSIATGEVGPDLDLSDLLIAPADTPHSEPVHNTAAAVVWSAAPSGSLALLGGVAGVSLGGLLLLNAVENNDIYQAKAGLGLAGLGGAALVIGMALSEPTAVGLSSRGVWLSRAL